MLLLSILRHCLAAVCVSTAVMAPMAVSAGQTASGALVGTVEDAQQARIPGATISARALNAEFQLDTVSGSDGEFRLAPLPPGSYRVTIHKDGFNDAVLSPVEVGVASSPSLRVALTAAGPHEVVTVERAMEFAPLETTSSVTKTNVTQHEINQLPLAARSFANMAYLAPMTEPVEPSDPTKARITAVSFSGSSGLNVDLSVDGGDNNDDFIGGFLQNFSPDAIAEFVVRTAQYGADTSRTNGGSIAIVTKHGTDEWHGGAAFFERASWLDARNPLDNPEPDPKAPFSRQNLVLEGGGPLRPKKLWLFSSAELVREDSSVAYSASSTAQFKALAELASSEEIPGVPSFAVPSSTPVPFRDQLFDVRLDGSRSDRRSWFFRGAFDLNNTRNNLVQQASLPSTGATTRARYFNFLVHEYREFTPAWIGSLTGEASLFHNRQSRNSNLGFALAFPFSSTYLTASGFETFGDNQFATAVTAFPVLRAQEKYQFRYDLSHIRQAHFVKFGVNVIHEPVLSGQLADTPERLVMFDENPTFYLENNLSILPLIQNTPVTPGFNGGFSQNVQRLGLYAEDSWRARPRLTVNGGARYDTTFGLFRAEGRTQDQNPAVRTLSFLGIGLSPGLPHDYRKALAPRLGIAYTPGSSGKTVLRAGVGLDYNDLAQSGWVEALSAVNTPTNGVPLGAADSGAVISPDYHAPYDLQASAGAEHGFNSGWNLAFEFEHDKGNHQYRAYSYVPGFTLPPNSPSITLYRTDNRSRFDGFSARVRRRSERVDLIAHYTLGSAATWGSVVGELFDYVNGVSNPLNAFGPGDYGPSGEDVRHRFVVAGIWTLPRGFVLSTIGQAESARPFTLSTPVDVHQTGDAATDRAVVDSVQTSLDGFRGTPFIQFDMRVKRDFRLSERVTLAPFVECFNLFNRVNPGNNFVSDISALPTPVNDLSNATALCLNSACNQTRPITSLNQLRAPAGALGDFFGPGTTVGIPFAAQFGARLSF